MTEVVMRHGLRIGLTGVPNSVVYEVSRKENERICRAIQQPKPADELRFLEIETKDGWWVLVSYDAVNFINFLWESTLPGMDTEDKGYESHRVRLFFRGQPKPLETASDDTDGIYGTAIALTGVERDDAMLAFTDEDGELMVINAANLMLAEFPAWLVAEGRKLVEEELDINDTKKH